MKPAGDDHRRLAALERLRIQRVVFFFVKKRIHRMPKAL